VCKDVVTRSETAVNFGNFGNIITRYGTIPLAILTKLLQFMSATVLLVALAG